MEGPEGPSMSASIYYVILACYGGYGCSLREHRELCEQHVVAVPATTHALLA